MHARLPGRIAVARRRAARALGDLLPKGLYARALLIIIVPMLLLQSILAFVFMERHWEYVTQRLSSATTRDIAMVVGLYAANPAEATSIIRLARQHLNLNVEVLPAASLPTERPKPFFRLLDKTLSRELRERVNRPFWLDTSGLSRNIDVRIRMDDAVLRIMAMRTQTYASNSHIFLLWMVGTSAVLLAIAIAFLRNQIKPVLALADAAERFGRGRPMPEGFRIRGAREVRQAAIAFAEMRDRIERHVEQRTVMLAGVSHDLRTVLTRFRLQLAMLGDRDAADALEADADEMQAMLEDYLAFAKGDAGEEAAPVDIAPLLEEVRATAAASGHNVTLHCRVPDMRATLKRHAFKRALVNLAVNATRFAPQVAIRAALTRRNLTVTVEDDGPGIPDGKREEVFRPFHSLDDARNQNTKSTGLGLAIARDIVRGHGGEITLSRSRMGGLKATVRVPV